MALKGGASVHLETLVMPSPYNKHTSCPVGNYSFSPRHQSSCFERNIPKLDRTLKLDPFTPLCDQILQSEETITNHKRRNVPEAASGG